MPNVAIVSALLLLALAGGFLFAYTWRLTRFLALRLEGQQLIFMAVGFAVPLVIMARLLLLGTPYIFSEFIVTGISRAWAGLVAPIDTPSLEIFFLAFVLGPILGWLFTLLSPKRKTSDYIIDRYGSELEQFLYNSVSSLLLVSVTLENRKVYIGWTGDTPKMHPRVTRGDMKSYFTLLPVVSGYRNPRTLKLEFTTEYTGVYEQIENSSLPLSINDFEIVIPVERVVTVNPFSLQIDQERFDIPLEETEETEEAEETE